MVDLDPAIAARFAWTKALTVEQVLTDPELAARFQVSYDVHPDYQAPDCLVEDVHIPGERAAGQAGAATVHVRVYRPCDGAPTAALVWAHGGGFVSGSLDMREADGVSRELATRAQALVVSVGYRLANGQDITYPHLHREVAAAFTWTRRRAQEMGLDPSRVQLGGASAGASLALSAMLEALASGEPLPGALQLIYPLAHRTLPGADTSHLDGLPELLRLRQPTIDQLLGAYLGPAGEAPYFELGEREAGGLPPALVVVSEYDDLRASGEDLTERLRAAGGHVDLHLAEGTIHGHLSLSGTARETERTLGLMAAHLRGQLSG